MRLRSHSAARRSLNGRGEVSLPLLIALTCGLICRGAAAQSLDPDWTLPNSASATPSAEARDAPLMRDYVAEVLATPPGGLRPPATSGTDGYSGPPYLFFDAAQQQQNAPRQALPPSSGRFGTGGAEPAGSPDARSAEPISVDPASGTWTFRDEAMNFTYSPPDSDWVFRTDIPNPHARLAVLHFTEPEIGGLIEASSDDGPLAGLTLKQQVETLKVGIAVLGGNPDSVRVEDRAVHGLPGKLMTVDTEQHAIRTTHVYWIANHGGRQYSISVWTRRADRDRLIAMADSIINGFRIIDESNSVPSSRAEKFSYTSPAAGFSLQLEREGWRRADELLEIGVAAEIGAAHANLTGLIVSPIPLQGHTPSLQAAVRGMLTLYGAAVRPEQLRNLKTFNDGDTQGVQFDFEQLAPAGMRRYRCRIFLKNDRAYVVCVTAPRAIFDDELADETLAGFQLDGPTQAPAPAAIPEALQRAQAGFFTGVGLHEFERGNFGGAATYFRLAASMEDQNPIHVENLVESLMQVQQHEQALQAIEHYEAILWNKGSLPVTRIAILLALQRFEESRQEFRALLQDGFWNEAEILNYLNALWNLDSAQAALDELLALPSRPGPASRDLEHFRADLLVEVGRTDEAIAVLKDQLAGNEGHTGLTCSLIAAYREAERKEEALALAERASADPRADVAVWLQKGITEFAFDRHADAKASLETANRMAPGVPLIEELLAAVTATLGQRDTQLVSAPIDPVALPAGVELADLATSGPLQDGASTYCPWRIDAVAFERDQPFRRTKYLSFVPADESAVQGLKTLSFTFHPHFEELYLNRIEIFDPQGQRVASADRHTAYLTHERQGPEATDEVTLNVPVPGLRPGYRLEAVVTTRELAPAAEFPYQFHLFGSSSPAGYDVLLIRGDVAQVKWIGRDPTSHTDDELVWVQRHVPGVPVEPQQAPASDFVPFVELADAGSTWEREIEDYLQRIEHRLATPAVTARLARQITDSSQPREIILALAGYVQKEFTYQALEFGRHTQEMAASDSVIANKYGDCKDLSLLLWQMLREHNINAHLALVHSSGELTPQLQTIEQCDHMVVYLPDIPGGHVIDPTCRWADPRLPVPSSLGGSHAVLLDPENPRVVRLPSCPAGQFERSVVADVRIRPDGSAEIQQKLQYEGYAAEVMRSLLGLFSPQEREDVVRQYFTTAGRGIAIASIRIDNLDELQSPLVIQLNGSVRDGLYRTGERLVGDIPLLSHVHLLSHEVEPARVTPFAFSDPLTCRAEIRLTPPEGWVVRVDRDPHAEAADDFLKWESHVQSAGDGARITSHFQRRAGHFLPSQRSDYLGAIDDMATALSPRIELHASGDARVQPVSAVDTLND